MVVKSERALHLPVDRAQQFLAENVAEDAADEHRHEQQEQDYEVLETESARSVMRNEIAISSREFGRAGFSLDSRWTVARFAPRDTRCEIRKLRK